MSTAAVVYCLVAALHFVGFGVLVFTTRHRVELTLCSVLAVAALALVWPFIDLVLLVSMARAAAKEIR